MMAQVSLNTWLTVCFAAALGGVMAGAVMLSKDATTAPNERQSAALTQLVAPAAPDTYALAVQDLTPSPATCVQDLDSDMQSLRITFEQGGTQITADHLPLLHYVAARVVSCPAAHLQIAGHANSSGTDQTDLSLSWNRAEFALAALVELGVDPAALEAVGYGARAPLAQGSDDDSAANSRIDFRVLRRRD